MIQPGYSSRALQELGTIACLCNLTSREVRRDLRDEQRCRGSEPHGGPTPAPIPEELHRKRLGLATVLRKFGNSLNLFLCVRVLRLGRGLTLSGIQRYKPTNWLASSRRTAKIAAARMARTILFITPRRPLIART